jgi:hypothetical protein
MMLLASIALLSYLVKWTTWFTALASERLTTRGSASYVEIIRRQSKNMVTIGDREVVFTGTFMAKNDERTVIETTILGTPFKFSMEFREDGESLSASWDASEGTPHFTFMNWKNPLGSCTTEPVKFGQIRDRRLYVLVSQFFIASKANLFHVFLLLDPPHGK